MPIFVEITPDPFATTFRGNVANDSKARQGQAGARPRSSFAHVRRPVRGIQIKEDTYATMEVRTSDGRTVPLVDAGGSIPEDGSEGGFAYTERYSNFILQSVQESRKEKHQVVQTFGEPYVFFFGEHPRIIQCSGVLLDTEDFNWRAEWWENYERYLRGTRNVQNRTRVTLSWKDIVVEGYVLQSSAQERARGPYHIQFNFQILLTNYQNVSKIGHSEFPANSANISLNPDEIETFGIGNLQSSTQEVRQRNVNSLQRGSKNSLVASLREQTADALGTVDGQVQNILRVAEEFVTGRKVRVPRGFGGSEAFDQETQIALASVDRSSRFVLLQNAAQNQTFTVTKSKRTRPVHYGRFQDNLDEYVASRISSNTSFDPPNLFEGQKASEAEAEDRVREVFEAFGVDIDPPRDVKFAAKHALFSFAALAVGAGFKSDEAAPLRTATNIVT